MVPDVLDGVVLGAPTGHNGEVAKGLQKKKSPSDKDLREMNVHLHWEKLPRKYLPYSVWVGQVLFCQINLGQNEDGALAARVHSGKNIHSNIYP